MPSETSSLIESVLTRASRIIQAILATLFLLPVFVSPAQCFETVSLKTYKTTATTVSNPVDLTRLALNKTFQVGSTDFILQFFFSGPDMLGVVFKRDLNKSLFVRWCFFRNCEESPHDFVSVIAQPHGPPLTGGFFQIKHPPGLDYHFQGLYFFTKS